MFIYVFGVSNLFTFRAKICVDIRCVYSICATFYGVNFVFVVKERLLRYGYRSCALRRFCEVIFVYGIFVRTYVYAKIRYRADFSIKRFGE